MGIKTEVLLWPAKVGTAPLRQLGRRAYDFASSEQIRNRRMQQDALDLERNNFLTAVVLAQTLYGRLREDAALDEKQRVKIDTELKEVYCDLGQRLVRAASDAQYAESLGIHDTLRPPIEA